MIFELPYRCCITCRMSCGLSWWTLQPSGQDVIIIKLVKVRPSCPMATRVIQIVQNAYISSVICPWILVVYLLVSSDPVTALRWNKNSLILHSNRDDNRVQITQLYERKNMLRLRCDARGPNASESLVLLGCPSVETGFCRENCISPCLIVGGELRA